MTTNPLLLCQIKDHIATLTFNTPDNLNALDEAMGIEFTKTLNSLKKNKEVRVVIITGAGRAFSSGGNLDMIEAKTKKKASTNQAELKKFYKMFLSVRDLPQPVIAAINGPAIGAGFCLSLACDLRYASDTAKLGANFAKIGLAPGMGGTFLITRLVGPTKASEIMLLAETFSAQKGFEYGLLNGVCAPDTLLPLVNQIAQKIAENGPLPVQMIKKGIQKAEKESLIQLFDYDSTCQAKCFTSDDIKEGITAIREKRKPNFKGK